MESAGASVAGVPRGGGSPAAVVSVAVESTTGGWSRAVSATSTKKYDPTVPRPKTVTSSAVRNTFDVRSLIGRVFGLICSEEELEEDSGGVIKGEKRQEEWGKDEGTTQPAPCSPQ